MRCIHIYRGAPQLGGIKLHKHFSWFHTVKWGVHRIAPRTVLHVIRIVLTMELQHTKNRGAPRLGVSPRFTGEKRVNLPDSHGLQTHEHTHRHTHTHTQGRRNVFSFGGGGANAKKGTIMWKRALTDAHADNIANVLMKHHCRQRFFLHAERFFFFFFFFFCWEELNKTSPPTPKINKLNKTRALQIQGSGCSLI